MEWAPNPEHLSARERQIAEAYAAGQSYREIAERLFIAPATVRTHLSTIYRKLGVSNKIALLKALETGAEGPGADFSPPDAPVSSASELGPVVDSDDQDVDDPAPAVAGTPNPHTPRADASVTQLLQGLDLHQYAHVFAANAVDMDVLMTLTDSDLRDLGMQAIGHRRRLAAAIHERRSSSDGTAGIEGGASEQIAPAMSSPAERRHLTISSVALVGAMKLSTELDPEQMQELLADYRKAVATEVARFQGHVASVMGDGMLVSFGWPNAHEDDAERAVRGALAMRASVGALRSPEGSPLAVRIGIVSGPVVVGEGMGHDAALAGGTPNLASGLRALASPGQVVIAENTRRLLGEVFELADLGTKRVEGIGEPVQAFAVTSERLVESRFDARSGSALLPMVGRDQELALLLQRWELAKAGEGQGVLLVGEAGIGKSRIARALLDAVADEPHFRVRYQCSPYHIDSALWPVIQQLNYAAALGADDPLDAKLDKLEGLLAQASGRDAAPLIADLIGLDGTARYGDLVLTPQVQRARTLEALVGQLLGLASLQPVLVVLEDAHWIDPTTLELIEQGLDCVADQPVLILLTSRPDQQPEFAPHLHVTRLALNRLARSGVEAMVARLGGDRLPVETFDTIIARTDGVPLFVEELTKAVLETGETAIPASLHDSLMARLDRITDVKEVTQVAACIGREFDHSLLAAVVDRSEPDLLAALDRLASAGLIFRRGTASEATYSFKHVLVRDAGYRCLLKGRRRELHTRIATVLEKGLTRIPSAEPQVVAHHWSEAGVVDKAIASWERAARHALSRSANREAAAHLRRALALVEAAPETQERHRTEGRLQLAVGAALIAPTTYASEEVRQAFARAELVSRATGDTEQRLLALRGLWNNRLVRGELREAGTLALQVMQLANQSRDPHRRLLACRVLGTSCFMGGEIARAQKLLERGIALHDQKDDSDYLALYGEDPGLWCRLYSAWADDILGFRDRGATKMMKAITKAENLPSRYCLAYTLGYAANLHVFRREPEFARERAHVAIALCTEQAMPQWLAWSTVVHGWALAALDEVEYGLAQIRRGLGQWHGFAGQIGLPHLLTLLAEALAAAGSYAEAMQALDEAQTVSERIDHRCHDVEVHRQRGRLALALGPDRDAAERRFQDAVQIARGQNAKSLELRATSSLAHLWAEQGERQKAHDLLAPIYDWFTEGFDTPDLIDAKELLDALP